MNESYVLADEKNVKLIYYVHYIYLIIKDNMQSFI